MVLPLKFNYKTWIDILSKISLVDTDPEDKRYGGFLEHEKNDVIARNSVNKIFRDFLADVKEKHKKNKDSKELIDIPECDAPFIKFMIRKIVEDYNNKELYYTLLADNGQANYQELVWHMSGDQKRNGVYIELDYDKGEDSYLHIFKNAIAICPPARLQFVFENFANQWAQLDGIDSKKEGEEKKNAILSNFHKMMRQTDMFGNGHACSIIYELWCVSDIPYRAFIAITKYINKTKNIVADNQEITKELPEKDLSWMWHCSSTPDNVLDYSHLTDVSDKITPALTKAAAHGFRLAMRRMEELGLIDMNDIDRKPNEIDQKTWDEKFKKESDED